MSTDPKQTEPEITDPVDPKPTEPQTDPKQPEDKPTEKTFTRDELARAVSAQIEKFKSDELPDMLKNARDEGAKEAKMSADELAEKREKEHEEKLNQLEQSLKKREAKLDAQAQLADSGLPSSVADTILPTLINMDADARATMIDSMKRSIEEAADQKVLEKTKGGPTPKTGSNANVAGMTQDKWNSLSYTQQAEIYKDDPETAKKFM